MMLFEHARQVLKQNGFLVEAEFSDFMKGERGGEPFYDLDNDYSYQDARRYFAGAFDGRIQPDCDDDLLDCVWFNRVKSKDKVRFERTYKQFEKYLNGEPLVLYRGVVMRDGKEVDIEDAGVCWTYSPRTAKTWAEDSFEKQVYNFHRDPDSMEMYVMKGITTLDNARLPYSIWLAGRFERSENEVRLKHSIPADRITLKKLPKND